MSTDLAIHALLGRVTELSLQLEAEKRSHEHTKRASTDALVEAKKAIDEEARTADGYRLACNRLDKWSRTLLEAIVGYPPDPLLLNEHIKKAKERAEQLRNDHAVMFVNLSNTQERCTELVEENRRLKSYNSSIGEVWTQAGLQEKLEEQRHHMGTQHVVLTSASVATAILAERRYIAEKLAYVCGPWWKWMKTRINMGKAAGERDADDENAVEP